MENQLYNQTEAENQSDSEPDAGDEGGEMKSRATLYLAMVYVFICVVGFTANAAVLVMIARSRRSKAVTNIYIFNLALADLLYAICLPAAIYQMLQGQWTIGHMMCKLYYTCDGVSKFASVMFLVILSFDRYMAVCHAIRCRAVRTAKLAFIITGFAWAIVIMAMVPVFLHAQLLEVTEFGSDSFQCVIYWPPSVQHGANEANASDTDTPSHSNHTQFNITQDTTNSTNDTSDDNYGGVPINHNRRIFTLYLFTLSFLVPLAMVWIFYTMILHRLRAQRRRLFSNISQSQTDSAPTGASAVDDDGPCGEDGDHQGSSRFKRPMLPSASPSVSSANQRRNRSTRRVTIMVLSIVICYTVCWIPYWYVQLMVEFFPETVQIVFGYGVFTIISYIAYGMQSANSMLNPFLYAFGTQTHRRRFLSRYRQWLTVGCRWRLFGIGAPPPHEQRDSLIRVANEAPMIEQCVVRPGDRLHPRQCDSHRKQLFRPSSMSMGESEFSQGNLLAYGKGDQSNQAPIAYCLCCYCATDEATNQKMPLAKRNVSAAGIICTNKDALSKDHRDNDD